MGRGSRWSLVGPASGSLAHEERAKKSARHFYESLFFRAMRHGDSLATDDFSAPSVAIGAPRGHTYFNTILRIVWLPVSET